MFYIGFRDEHTAQIGIARHGSADIGSWRRHPANPVICIRPGRDRWDADACYKPSAISTAKWLLWYNGQRELGTDRPGHAREADWVSGTSRKLPGDRLAKTSGF